LNGTGWYTADGKGIWRPVLMGQHDVSFGFHYDQYKLNNPVFFVSNWQSGDETNKMLSLSQGKTQTEAYWLQDAWDFQKDWTFTLGGRLENWHAYDGVNVANVVRRTGATANLATVNQPNRNDLEFSPKGKIAWRTTKQSQVALSVAQAYRFPTVTELFQTSSVNIGGITTIANGNPNLQPEKALSSELAGEYYFANSKLRLSLFQERIKNAIYTQPGLFNNVVINSPQNVGETQTYGIEFAGDGKDVFFKNLDLMATGTWASSTITENSAADAAAAKQALTPSNPYARLPSTGKMQPRVPEWRASFTVTYHPIPKLSTSVSGRYSSRQYSQLNNSDFNGFTYTGNTCYFVVDLRARYEITRQFSVAAGIDNVNNAEYWIFHPFPARTYSAELKFNY
jgi:iron complex outermembrane receptor protein